MSIKNYLKGRKKYSLEEMEELDIGDYFIVYDNQYKSLYLEKIIPDYNINRNGNRRIYSITIKEISNESKYSLREGDEGYWNLDDKIYIEYYKISKEEVFAELL